MDKTQAYRFDASSRNEKEKNFMEEINNLTKNCELSEYEKFQNFPLFTPRQDISRYLAKAILFEKILEVHGVIIECGCLYGGGLLWWYHLSSIFEPVNHIRKIIGLDTFSGFPELNKNEMKESQEAKKGGLSIDSYNLILNAAKTHDLNRSIGHIPKIELYKGDAIKTIPEYIKKIKEPIALLYLDFDIEEPTKIAIENLIPRMPKGAIIGLDEFHRGWGESKAVIENLNLNGLEIKRFPWTSTISYCVI